MTKRDLQRFFTNFKEHSPRVGKNPMVRKAILLLIPLLVILFIIFSVSRLLMSSSGTQQLSGTQVAKPLATTQINKEYSFSLKDSAGKEVGTFKYKVLTAELDKQIIIKGQRATAVDGREFLIVNLELTNGGTQGIQVNTRDYVRLSIPGVEEPLAPEIHNDPLEVQAISTEFTRVGFPIDVTNKTLSLQVGEITGSKDTLQLKFK